MGYTLSIADENALSTEAKNEIDAQIDQIIAAHKNNRYEVNRLAFESAAALAEGDNYASELNNQGFFKRKWNNFTGKNARLQGQIDEARTRAQYASQRTLQKLAEQNVLSFELITAVNNKLNASLIQVDEEFNEVYRTISDVNSRLVAFFKSAKSDIIQLENRVQRLERNVNLLNWQNSIEYQMWDGIEYTELDDISKIVCMVRDFYDITKGSWTTSDLLLLKTAMATIGLPPKGSVCYNDFINTVCSNKRLFEKLFDGFDLCGTEQYASCVALTAGIQKSNLLETSESGSVTNTAKFLKKHGCEMAESEIKNEMLAEYEAQKAHFDIGASVNLYDFMLELLYNMEQIKEIMKYRQLEDKLKTAETLFSYYHVKAVFPMLEELASYGFVKAKYMLALIYETGYTDIPKDSDKVNKLLDECIAEGYAPSLVRRILPILRDSTDDRKSDIADTFNELKQLADNGDTFAANEFARCCCLAEWLGIQHDDYVKAIEYFNKSPLLLSYFWLIALYTQDLEVDKAYELYQILVDSGYSAAESIWLF